MTGTYSQAYWTRLDGLRKKVAGTITITAYTTGGENPTLLTGWSKSLTNFLDVSLGRSSAGFKVEMASGLIRAYRSGAAGGIVTDILPNVKGGIFAAITADAAAAALNDAACLALTDATVTSAGGLASTAGKVSGFTQPNAINAEVIGRNVVVAQKATGGATVWPALSALRVTGTDPITGAVQTEDIPLQLTSIADTKFRLNVGTKAFGTITSARLIRTDTAASQAGPAFSFISLGVGTIYGLRGKINVQGDIKSVLKGTTPIAAAVYIGSGPSPSQIDMGADVADAVNLTFEFDAVASSLLDREAVSGENIGTIAANMFGS